MNIIIFGAGKTGQYLTKIFSVESHDVTVIEQDSEICSKLSSTFDASVIQSEGIKRNVFNKQNFSQADLFIAVTSVDELNIMACSFADKLGAKKTIARVRNEDYDKMEEIIDIESHGVDLVIHPEKELTKELINLVKYPDALDIYEVLDGKLLITSLKVKEDTVLAQSKLSELPKDVMKDMRIVVVEKGNETIIPSGDYQIEPNDKIYFIAKKENINNFFTFAGCERSKKKMNRIMINGSGNLTKTLALELESFGKFTTKIIVNDEKEAEKLSEDLKNTLIVHGEATDIDILATEGIIDMDFYLALTENDESNMVSALLANHLNVERTITRIEKTDYIPISKTIGLGRCVNSSIATTNAIMRYVRHGKVRSSSTLKGISVDVITFQITDDSKYKEKQLYSIKFPPNAIVAAIHRNGNTMVPKGDDMFLKGDEIVVFTERNSIKKIENMFGK